ncbi:conserved protein of unknown function, might be Sel1 domain protein repeat-containing protein [Shewanella benthica]|uniref:DUF4145 domain-containing protein n=1 Tax=Shewanella benthica TaxID=43661 RepID=A0A330LY17_9GAMM|nr:DUF4145 domain-containing protein [Shewanella benthica]SQH74781.1 conserved protein of unknown function, might be Sel1 domain protein repeat-containing protein [Shewanella benthica]
MLTDVELVTQFSAELGHDYGIAKSYVKDVPTQALLLLRSLTHKLTDLLAESKGVTFTGPNLYDRIETLNSKRVIDVRITRALHRLRGDGNRGAHPEKYHLTAEQLQQLSEKSIEKLLKLIESLFKQVTGESLPQYKFAPFDLLVGRDLCYRAVMQGEAEAQYLVGMSLKTRALMQQEQELALEASNDEESTQANLSSDTLAKAQYWFSLAAERNMNAMHEHGVALIHGYNGEADVVAGERAIALSAQAGVANAMALLGYFYLVGSETVTIDLDKAQEHLQGAAELEQSEAMANLGVLFYQQGDLLQANDFISQAAKAGFPHAQYHLALMLAKGEGTEIDLLASDHWMKEAAEQGQLDAMFSRAQAMLNDDDSTSAELALAESYLREVIKYGHSVPAMVELSIALADGMLNKIDVVGSAALLKLAKERANSEELAVIEPLWNSLLQQVENVLFVATKEEELAALERAKELLSD